MDIFVLRPASRVLRPEYIAGALVPKWRLACKLSRNAGSANVSCAKTQDAGRQKRRITAYKDATVRGRAKRTQAKPNGSAMRIARYS